MRTFFDSSIQSPQPVRACAETTAAAILAAREPGFQPGGHEHGTTETLRVFSVCRRRVLLSRRQDGALTARQGFLPPRICVRAVRLAAGLGLVLSLYGGGCRKSASEAELPPPARSTREAATQLEQVFQQAPPAAKENAAVASTAIRSGDYEKAVVSLVAVRDQGGLTPAQGLAIHNSMVAMEAKLITAMESGDKNARRAYETFKKLTRN